VGIHEDHVLELLLRVLILVGVVALALHQRWSR
jgi:hypothetical protein